MTDIVTSLCLGARAPSSDDLLNGLT